MTTMMNAGPAGGDIQNDLLLENQKLQSENEKHIEELNTLKAEIQKKNAPKLQPLSSKCFVLKHVFEDVSKMEDEVYYNSELEDHFGVFWNLSIERELNYLTFFINCSESINSEDWRIEIECDLKLTSVKEFAWRHHNALEFTQSFDSRGFERFVKWDEMTQNFLVDDKLVVEARLTIKNTTGIYKANLRSFDESTKDVSDVVLSVNDEKFFVSKLTLAAQSSYFKTLFLGGFEEANKSEIKLYGIDPSDFQKFLEVVYGEDGIDDSSVEGILLIADMFDTEIAIRKCQNFLMKKSKKSLKKKLEMSGRYNLANLKAKCLGENKTVTDIRSWLWNTQRWQQFLRS